MSSFMFSIGLTCPTRETIENAGYRDDVLAAKIKLHEKNCEKCKADLDELYRTGFLNGKRE
jgi:hypothetical protein